MEGQKQTRIKVMNGKFRETDSLLPRLPQLRSTISNLSISVNTPNTQPDTPGGDAVSCRMPVISLSLETLEMTKMFLLISLQCFCEFGPQTISNMMIGHLPVDPQMYLAGVGLARTFANVLGSSVGWGLTTALFTLIPHALGSQNKRLIAIYTQRCFVVTLVALIPLSALQFFGGNFMCWIGEPCHLTSIVNQYCQLLIPYIYLFTWLCILQRLMQSLEFNFALWAITLIGFAAAYPVFYLMIYVCELGYLGAAVGQSIVFAIQVILCVVYLVHRGYGYIFVPQEWGTLCDVRGLKEYMHLALPGLFQGTLEWWVLELANILSGFVTNSDTAIAATTVISNMDLVCVALALGTSNSISVRAGKYVGAGTVYYAQRACMIGMCLGLFASLAVAAILMRWRHEVPTIWTYDTETDALVSDVMFVFCVLQLSMNLVQGLSGIYRSLGFQTKSAWLVICSYYLVGLPFACILMFGLDWRESLQKGSYAIWGGLALGCTMSALSMFSYLVCCLDWNEGVASSQARIQRGLNEMKSPTKYQSLASPNRVSAFTPVIL